MLDQKIVDTVKKLQIASRNIPKIWDGRELYHGNERGRIKAVEANGMDGILL